MASNQRRLYGIVALLVLGLIISSSFALMYFTEYSQEQASNQKYISELNSANQAYEQAVAKYNSAAQSLNDSERAYNGSVSAFDHLATTFNATVAEFNLFNSNFESLSIQYNLTLSLLTSSIAALNTSSAVYVTSSKELTQLWRSYLNSVRSYENLVKNFTQIVSSFKSEVVTFESSSNVSRTSIVAVPTPMNPQLLSANFLIDFGNGTKLWYNDTAIQPGWNLYVATLVITNGDMNATYYPSFGEHLVNGILGVESTSTKYWFAWSFQNSTWSASSSGADLIQIYNGSDYAWSFCGANSTTFLPTCPGP